MEIDRVLVRLGADASQFFGVFDEVESRLVAFGSYAVLHAISGIAKLGMEWEAMTTSFQTMIGSIEKGSKVLNEIRDLAIRTPFTTHGLARAGEMLLGFGVGSENIVGVLERLGDIAGGNESKLMRLALAFGQVSTAGRFMGTELRQFTEAGVGAADFAKAYGTTEAKFLRDVRQGKVGVDAMVKGINMLTDPGGRFAGRSDALFRKVIGQWNAFLESIQKNAADLGVKFFEKFDVAERIGNASKWVEGLKSSIDPVLNWIERALPILQEFYDFFKSDWMSLQGFIGDMFGSPELLTLEEALSLIQDVTDGFMEFSQTVLVTFAKIGETIIDNVHRPFLDFTKMVSDTVVAMEQLAREDPLFKIVENLFGTDGFSEFIEGIVDGFKEVYNLVKDIVNFMVPGFLETWKVTLEIRAVLFDVAKALNFNVGGMVQERVNKELSFLDKLDPRNKDGNLLQRGLFYLGEDLGVPGFKDAMSEPGPQIPWIDPEREARTKNQKTFSKWFRDKLDLVDFLVKDRNSPEAIEKMFEDQKKILEAERKKSQAARIWKKGRPLFDLFLAMQGFEPLQRKPKEITTPFRLPADIEKFAAGIEQPYNKRFPLLSFVNDLEKIRRASEGFGPGVAATLQMFTGANFLQTPIALNPALNQKQSDWALFRAFESLKGSVNIDMGTKLPQAIRKGTIEAQEIINRAGRPEMTAQEEMRRVLEQSKAIMEAQEEYQRQMVEEIKNNKSELEKIRKNLNGEDL